MMLSVPEQLNTFAPTLHIEGKKAERKVRSMQCNSMLQFNIIHYGIMKDYRTGFNSLTMFHNNHIQT